MLRYTLRRSSDESTKNARDTADLLLYVLVPDDREDRDTTEQHAIRTVPNTKHTNPMLYREVLAALKRKNSKAPGLYLMKVIALMVASEVSRFDQPVRLLNRELGSFPALPGMFGPLESS